MQTAIESSRTCQGFRLDTWLRRILAVGLENLKLREHLFPMTVAILIGVLGGYSAVLLRVLIDAGHQVFWGAEAGIELLRNQPVWKLILVPGVGGLLVGLLVTFLSPESKGHGVPEVMTAVALKNGIIRARVAVAKTLASALTIASGGSAGREGPIIQIGAAIGSVTGQLFRVSRARLRTFIGCGAAAGIAATFNAPIAGALFSVEVILGDFGMAQFGPIVISSVLATVVARHYLGTAPVFDAQEYHLVSGWEGISYLLLAVVCAAVSVIFIRALCLVEETVERRKRIPRWVQPMIGGLLLGCMGPFLPHIYGDGHDAVDLALLDRLPALLLLVLLFAKILGTSFTLGSGGSGGVFSPSLFIGAMAGGLIGRLSSMAFGDLSGSAGGYALVGMGGLVAATSRAPIMAILVIFELTGSYSIILPLMGVCIVSTVMSSRLCPESIYTFKLKRRGIDLFHGRSLDVLKGRIVREALRKNFSTVSPDTNVHTVMQNLLQGEHSQLYVVNAEGSLKGVISLSDARRIVLSKGGLEHVLIAGDICHANPPLCAPDKSLSEALLLFPQSRLTELPVVDNMSSRRLLGVLEYSDVVGIYNEELLRLDTPGTLASRLAASSDNDRSEVARGFSIADWEPPSAMWGKTLNEAELPSRYGVRVMLVKTPDSNMKEEIAPLVPGADYRIRPSDVLVVYGRNEDIDLIRRL